jgi:hypothetical protein
MLLYDDDVPTAGERLLGNRVFIIDAVDRYKKT